MKTNADVPPIQLSYRVPTSETHAFEMFVQGLASWWPQAYTWAGDRLQTIGIEPQQGGACYEIDVDGQRREWGRVLAYESPRRIVFTWQIGFDREFVPDLHAAGEIEFRCTAIGPSETQVEFEHRHFNRHGADAAAYREAMAAPEGWPYILSQYLKALSA